MCGKRHPGVSIPTCLFFFHTCLVKVKHLPNKTCVLFYTQVWLLPSIFVKSQTCVKITMSVQNILAWFFEGKKDSLIRSCSFSHNFGLFTFPFFKCCPHILSFFVSCVKNKHFHFPPQLSSFRVTSFSLKLKGGALPLTPSPPLSLQILKKIHFLS